MNRWEDRVALVTGASSGIGAAICKELVKYGMTVVGCGRRVERIEVIGLSDELTEAPGELHPIMCDLSVEEDITDMFNEIRNIYGRVDVCINNAGFATDSSLADGDEDEWKEMLDVNIMGLCMCTKKSLQLMESNKISDGIIIHIGSIVGHRVPEGPANNPDVPALGFYYGVKFMVRGLAESLRQELKSANSTIRVATISPGAVQTEFFGRAYNEEAATDFFAAFQCLQPEDIAALVVDVLKTPPNVNVQDIMVQPVDFFI